jgi:hypothetical protein
LPAGLDDQKILVIGQKLAVGTATEKTLLTNIAENEVNGYFGERSALACALRAMFEEFDECAGVNYPRIDVIALEDNSGGNEAEASVTLSASGVGTELLMDVTIKADIGGKDISLACTAGDDIITDIAPALAEKINEADIPVTASEVGGVITLTYNHKGTIGNNTTIRFYGLSKVSSDYFLSNMEIEVAGFTGGSDDPTLTNLLDVVDKVRYQTITYPYEYGADLATDFLDPRFNVANAIKDGVAILKATDSKADLVTALGLLNSQNLVVLCNKEVSEDNFIGGEDLEIDFVASARVSALRGLRLTEGANIINITPASTDAPRDAKGGAHIASLPYFNTPTNSPLQPEGRGWTDTEVKELKTAGGSVMGNNVAGNAVILGQLVTTYKTDPAGNDDSTWKFLNAVDTMSVCAEYMFKNIKKDFVQARLTGGDMLRGFNMVNKAGFNSAMSKYFLALGGLTLVPKSKAASDFFASKLVTVLDMVNGKITSSGDLPIVVQLREVIANLKTSFEQI